MQHFAHEMIFKVVRRAKVEVFHRFLLICSMLFVDRYGTSTEICRRDAFAKIF